MKLKLFSHIREDTCVSCNKDRAIELYDMNDNPIRFTFILDSDKRILIDRRQIHYGKCNYCNTVFALDWRNNIRVPTPLTDINLINYIQQYSKSKIV